MKLFLVLFILNLGLARGIHWNEDWAFGCDFQDPSISSANVPGELCSQACASFTGCTHFTWVKDGGFDGTCYFKTGVVSKSDAISVADQSRVCGGLLWEADNWAFSCDFNEDAIGGDLTRGEQCSAACAAFPGCTHFTWIGDGAKEGRCWFRGGPASKSNAFYTSDPSMVCGVLADSSIGVFVPWPKRVLGIYVPLADDAWPPYTSYDDWTPILFPYQQTGANVLYFAFINAETMHVPISFINLAKSRGNGQPGSVPADTVIIFSIGGFSYSYGKVWPWLTSKAAAEAMAEEVAKWPNAYNCDGIDLDIEEGAGNVPGAGENLVHFIRKLKQLVPKMIITQPTYGYPEVPAEIYVINQSWSSTGTSSNLADAIGIMFYEGAQSLNYAHYYTSGGAGMTCKAPHNAILVSVAGDAAATDILAVAEGVNSNNYRGMFTWSGSVQNGFHYGNDASFNPASQEAFIKIKSDFASQN